MKKVIILTVILLASLLSYSQEEQQNNNNDSIPEKELVASYGFTTTIYKKNIESWYIGGTLLIIPKKIGVYADFSYSYYVYYIDQIDNSEQNILYHIGAAYKINGLFRPFVGIGLRHNRIRVERNSPSKQFTFNSIIGVNIGTKKSIIGGNVGFSIDFSSDFQVLPVLGITIVI